jgi:WD40 repeat protein
MQFSIPTRHPVYDISVHPDGKRVAAATGGGTAMVISVTTGDTLFDLSGHGASIRTIAYGPSGKRIATGALLLCLHSELHRRQVKDVTIGP